MFQVSRSPSGALCRLDAAGLIASVSTASHFVKRSPTPRDASPMNLLVSQIAAGRQARRRVIRVRVCVPTESVRDLLKLKAGQQAQGSVRIAAHQRRPIMHLTTYVPEAIARSYSRKDLERIPLYRLWRAPAKL